MDQFCHLAHLKELHMRGRLFTWSNKRISPMIERIDRAFMTNGWDQLYPSCDLHFLASQCSDHAPLLLRMDSTVSRHRLFQFRSFWTSCAGFTNVILRARHCPLADSNPFRHLDWLLQNTARCL
jgi:hypothetical protein